MSESPGQHEEIHAKAQKGIGVMISRRVVLQLISTVGGILLARILDPADFGIFGITTFLVGTIAMFSSFGLAPSLIQQRDELKDKHLQVGFTTQLVLISIVVVIIWFAAPFLASLYPQIDGRLVWLIRVVAFNLYLSTWRSISAIILERKLAFKKVAFAEIVETTIYQVVSVGMAWMGYGVWSLVVAIAIKGVVGTVLLYFYARWKIRFAWDADIVRDIFQFGIPFQIQRVVGNVKKWVTPTVVAALIGPEAVGFLTWSFKLGKKPMYMLSTPVARVSFSHFSRLQDDKPELGLIVQTYIKNLLPLFLLWAIMIIVDGDRIISVVYTDKWLPALPALMIYAVNVIVGMFGNISINALNASGNVRYTLKVTMISSIFQFAFATALVFWVGFIGVPIAVISSALVVIPFYFKGLEKGLIGRIGKDSLYLVPAVISAFALGYASKMLPVDGFVGMLIPLVVVGLAFLGAIFVFSRDEFHGFKNRLMVLLKKI